MNIPIFRIGPLAVDRNETVWYSLAIVSMAAFLVGMALLGVSRISGYFYLLALIAGAPVLLRMDFRSLPIPRAVIVYVLFVTGFSLVCLAQWMTGRIDLSIFDYVSRMWAGVINGFFFLVLFRADRRSLFAFIGLVAASHAAVAIGTALIQGVDFSNLWVTGDRAGGMTNPIPYSNMLFVSVGLTVIVLAGEMSRRSLFADIGVVTLVVLAGLCAVVLTGTRGTLLAAPLMILLVLYSYRNRFGRRAILAAAGGLAALAVATLVTIQLIAPDSLMWAVERAGSDRLRMQLWGMSWPIFQEAPLFGHGLASVPQVFLDLGLVASERSRLFFFNHMHNQYLDMLVKTGLVGTVMFYGPLVTAAIAAISLVRIPGERAFGLAILWIVGAYSTFGLTTSYFSHANTILQLGVYLGMAIWLVPPRGEPAAVDAQPLNSVSP